MIFQDCQVEVKRFEIIGLIEKYFFVVQIQFDGINDPSGISFKEDTSDRALSFDFAFVWPVTGTPLAVVMLVLMEEKPHGFRLSN